MPGWQLKVAGVFVPMVRELDEVSYQFAAPFVVDDSETRDLLGVTATDWSTVLTARRKRRRRPRRLAP